MLMEHKVNAEMGEGHVARRLGQEGPNLMGDTNRLGIGWEWAGIMKDF